MQQGELYAELVEVLEELVWLGETHDPSRSLIERFCRVIGPIDRRMPIPYNIQY